MIKMMFLGSLHYKVKIGTQIIKEFDIDTSKN